jgi:hypothetical protein
MRFAVLPSSIVGIAARRIRVSKTMTKAGACPNATLFDVQRTIGNGKISLNASRRVVSPACIPGRPNLVSEFQRPVRCPSQNPGLIHRVDSSAASVTFINNTRNGDRVVSAKDDGNGLPGGLKQIGVQLTPGSAPASSQSRAPMQLQSLAKARSSGCGSNSSSTSGPPV